MKEMIDRIQDLGRKAAQLKQVVASAPAHVAEIRQAVAITAGQLQQLRSEVQVNVAGLRASDGPRVVALLTEIVGQTGPLREAGYEIAGVELEVDPIQRVFLLLDKLSEVSATELQSVLAAQATRPGLYGLLVALVKAEELADTITLPGLVYRRLRVEVGPVPTIRLCWQAGSLPPLLSAPPVATTTRASTPDIASMFGEGSFFERRPSVVSPSAPELVDPLVTPTLQVQPTAASSTEGYGEGASPETVRSSALDRFKKMPDLGKRAR